ncbi:ATP-grasp domain-containing protein [Alicyclobacillus tolerans]|uniref:ATP-grasp domain-containing protein n=1 Tax=Alicyclobacillus tolerans TaxID=90970 RepID=UPI003B8099F8
MNKAIVFIEVGSILNLLSRADAAHRMGYHTICVVEVYEYEKFCREYHVDKQSYFDVIIPINNFSYENLLNILYKLQKNWEIIAVHNVASLCHSQGYIAATVALLANDLGLPNKNHSSIIECSNKYLMREKLYQIGLQDKDYALVTSLSDCLIAADFIGYPLILKPVNGSASHLILKADNKSEFVENYQYMCRRIEEGGNPGQYNFAHNFQLPRNRSIFMDPRNMFLVEKYLDGPEVSIEMIVFQNQVVPLLIHDKVILTEERSKVLEHFLVTPPDRLNHEQIDELLNYAETAIDKIKLNQSFVHLEMRYDKNSGPRIIEINPRIGGMLVPQSLKTYYGMDVSEWEILLCTGSSISIPAKIEQKNKYAMFTIYPNQEGVLLSIEGLEECRTKQGVVYIHQVYPNGTHVYCQDEEMFLVVGWLQGNSVEFLKDLYHEINQRVNIRIETNSLHEMI